MLTKVENLMGTVAAVAVLVVASALLLASIYFAAHEQLDEAVMSVLAGAVGFLAAYVIDTSPRAERCEDDDDWF